MSWDTSDRRRFLPKDWEKRRQARFELDGYQCTEINANTGERCTEPAEEVDHTGHREDHRLDKLRSLCSWHHKQRTAQQSAAARAANRRRIAKKYQRET